MNEEQQLNLQPGTILNGRYEVVRALGAGSMGMVYACRHRELAGRLVAMKVLFPEVANDETAKIRFENEIFASYEVNHPNVVRAYEYFHDNGLVAFTMEYIGGGDLADRLNSSTPIEIEQIIKWFRQMASGLQAIHEAGIIHRDLKPENILLTSGGEVKITDFGIARTGIVRGLTQHGGVIGTIDYVSPEYLEKGQVDERSDIYSLGILGYEMITLQAAFSGNSLIETMTARIKNDPIPPGKLRVDCPDKLSDIVMKALARNPEERYQTAQEMTEELEILEDSFFYENKDEDKQEPKAVTVPPPVVETGFSEFSKPLLPDELLSRSYPVLDDKKKPSVDIDRPKFGYQEKENDHYKNYSEENTKGESLEEEGDYYDEESDYYASLDHKKGLYRNWEEDKETTHSKSPYLDRRLASDNTANKKSNPQPEETDKINKTAFLEVVLKNGFAYALGIAAGIIALLALLA